MIGRITRRGSLVAACAAALALTATRQAGAQVGYTPAASPYTDVYRNHEIAVYSGWYFGGNDPAGVAPGDGLATGIRYGWHAGGPAILVADFARFGTHRMVKDPNSPEGAGRNVADESWPLYSMNLGLDLALTGEKSWHHLAPVVKGGVGFVSDMKAKADTGGFKFGTRFAFNLGAGIRWVPAGHWGLRADFDNRFYTVAYPTAYFLPPNGGGNPILQGAKSKSSWTVNPVLSLGLTYNFGR